tara:strand:+ start:3315 stop:4088 length:774 start_codon:yes stop_codon:yes gene_type:complete
MTDRQFSDGEYIFRVGDPADGVFRIESGEVRLQGGGNGGGSAAVCGGGDVFGGDGLLTGDTRTTDAVAVGPVTVAYLRRNEFLAILTLQPTLLSPVFAPVFDLVADSMNGMARVNGGAAPDSWPAAPAAATTGGAGVRLFVDSKRLRSALGTDEIEIPDLPFRIGRTASGEGKDTYTDINLALPDSRPFNLSRRHFSIEEEDGALVVRDFGSYHGTTVNGLTLGGEGRPRTAPLMTGESVLVAGKPNSPFRFRILVE